jgi:hypothetical protein
MHTPPIDDLKPCAIERQVGAAHPAGRLDRGIFVAKLLEQSALGSIASSLKQNPRA